MGVIDIDCPAESTPLYIVRVHSSIDPDCMYGAATADKLSHGVPAFVVGREPSRRKRFDANDRTAMGLTNPISAYSVP